MDNIKQLYTENEIGKITKLQSNIDKEILKVQENLTITLEPRKAYGLDVNKKRSKDRMKTIIFGQYVTCVRILNDFFKFIKKQSWTYNKIGQCFTTDFSQMGICGPLGDDFTAQQVNTLMIEHYEGMELGDNCLFHNQYWGCILGAFKGPICTASADGYMPKSYNDLLIKDVLESILLGGYNSEKGKYFPYENRIKVIGLISIIKRYLDELKNENIVCIYKNIGEVKENDINY